MAAQTPSISLQQRIDLCVKCGLCLPSCPTYQLERHEGDSPRGRLALIHALASGELPATATVEHHLDGCLSCRACERVCPASVPFGAIADAGRALLAGIKPRRLRGVRVLQRILANASARGLLRRGIRALQGLGILRIAAAAHWPGRRLAGIARYPVRAAPAGDADDAAADILLFRGCVTDIFERDAIGAARRLLQAAGWRVREPRGQTCCGALSQHAGDLELARAMARTNVAAFPGPARIVGTASGCSACLHDYPELLGAGAAAFTARLGDIAVLLLERSERLRFRPLHQRIVLHAPCTLRNVLRTDHAWRELLQRIPGAEIVDANAPGGCCGAAGLYFLQRPATADRLLDARLAELRERKGDLVVSPNIGCSLHLAAGAQRQGLRLSIRHPLSLLAEQLEAAG